MRCRAFYLQDAAGERYDLTGKHGVYVRDPAGLGIAASPTFADLRHGFFLPTSSDARPQETFTGTLVFTRNPYQTYRQFTAWLSHAGSLVLVYDPDGSQEYYKGLSINFLQKGELSQVGWLEVPFSFFQTTPWYLPVPTSFDVSASSDRRAKRYSYRYTETLRYGANAAGVLSAVLQGAGDDPGAITVRYLGAATNPALRLVGNVSGKTYGSCAAAVTLLPSDTMEYSSSPIHSHLYRISANGTVTDLLPVIRDLSACWFQLPIDEPCTLSLEADSYITGRATITVFYYYWSV